MLSCVEAGETFRICETYQVPVLMFVSTGTDIASTNADVASTGIQ